MENLKELTEAERLKLGEDLEILSRMPEWESLMKVENIAQEHTKSEVLSYPLEDNSNENCIKELAMLRGALGYQQYLWNKRIELINDYKQKENEA